MNGCHRKYQTFMEYKIDCNYTHDIDRRTFLPFHVTNFKLMVDPYQIFVNYVNTVSMQTQRPMVSVAV